MAGPLCFGALPNVVGFSQARRLPAQAAEGIDQIAVTRRVDQRAVVVLPVDLDQGLTHLAQQLHTHADVVDEGAAPSVGPLHASQDQRVLGHDAVVGKQREHGMALG